MVEHVDLTDPELHEPKGASSANTGEVLVAAGLGGTGCQLLDETNLDTTALYADIAAKNADDTIAIAERFVLSAVIPDISTAGFVLIPIPESCTILGATLVLGGTIATANAVISFFNASAASLGSNVTVTFAGSLEGDLFGFVATTNQNLTGPTYIKIATDGGSDNAVPLYITIAAEIPA